MTDWPVPKAIDVRMLSPIDAVVDAFGPIRPWATATELATAFTRLTALPGPVI